MTGKAAMALCSSIDRVQSISRIEAAEMEENWTQKMIGMVPFTFTYFRLPLSFNALACNRHE